MDHLTLLQANRQAQPVETRRKPASITVFFPLYNDERTVRTVAEKALRLIEQEAEGGELIMIDDGSPDRSGEIADELSREHANVTVIHHLQNLGYGAAIRSGLAAATGEFICFTDGDDEYEVDDFRKLLRLRDYYDLVITFRYRKIYSNKRIFISWVYNHVLRFLFRTPFRDISTGLRLVRRDLLEEVSLDSSSPFIGAELAIKTMLKGYRVGEVGIQTFPRSFGKGSSTSLRNIVATMKDLVRIYRQVFSDTYDCPPGRAR